MALTGTALCSLPSTPLLRLTADLPVTTEQTLMAQVRPNGSPRQEVTSCGGTASERAAKPGPESCPHDSQSETLPGNDGADSSAASSPGSSQRVPRHAYEQTAAAQSCDEELAHGHTANE